MKSSKYIKKEFFLTQLVFELVNNKAFDKEFGFKDQIKKAVISITNNIAEGSEYNNNKQFIRYLKISKEVSVYKHKIISINSKM